MSATRWELIRKTCLGITHPWLAGYKGQEERDEAGKFKTWSSPLPSLLRSAGRGAKPEWHDIEPNPRITYVFRLRAEKQWARKQNNTQKINAAKQAVQIVWQDAKWSPQLEPAVRKTGIKNPLSSKMPNSSANPDANKGSDAHIVLSAARETQNTVPSSLTWLAKQPSPYTQTERKRWDNPCLLSG